MKKLSLRAGMLVTAFLLGVAYTNCSKVAFDSAELSSEQGLGEQDVSSGSILINEGAPFTNSEDVVLRLEHNSASEMYITDSMNCATGGVWEPYSKSKMWKISGKNQNVKVYAKFRESSAKDADEMEYTCYNDDITHDDIAPLIAVKRAPGNFFNQSNFEFQYSVTDENSGVGNIRCATDVSWTSGCNQVIKNHAMVEGSHNIKIEAIDKAGNKALPVEDSFVIDLTPPVVVFNSTPSAITGDVNGRFTFSGTDALSGVSKYECKVNGGGFGSCTSPHSMVYPEGSNSFQVRAIDNAGNVSSPISYTWKVDATAPTVRITKAPPAFSNSSSALFEFDGFDEGVALTVFRCKIDGGSYVSCNSPLNLTNLSEGSHTFSVVGYDSAGNESSPASYTWIIDRTKPVVTITSAPPSRTNNNNASFSFTATDAGGSGVSQTQCSLDGAAYSSCNSPQTYANLTEGNHSFYVRAIDNAGNVGDPANYSWVVDTTKPVVTITSGPAAQVKDLSASLTFIATDANGGSIARIECRLDSSANWETCASPKSYSNLGQGAHTFYVRAIDSVGNISDVKSHNWFVDNLPPSIAYTSSASASISNTTPVQINYSITDAGVGLDLASIRCGLNGVRMACDAVKQINYSSLAVGSYVYRIEAADLLGNSSAAEIKWTVTYATVAKAQNLLVKSNNKADVLVVIDNSGSMNKEQQNMAARFGSFLDQLNDLDWQVGIVTTDMSGDANKKNGRLLEFSGLSGTYVITSNLNYNTAKTAFASTIQRPASEGSGNEQGIAATYSALERALDASTTVNRRNASLIRDGAVLSVIVVTDADETPPNGVQYKNIPANLNNDIAKFWPGKSFNFNSIIVKPGDSACLNKSGYENEGYGFSYKAMSDLTNGVIGTVCSEDYGSQLAAIGKATVELIKSANLDCAPIDSNNDGKGDVQIVTADGSAAPSYTINGLSINFSAALPVGTNQLRYTCLAN